MYPSRFQNHIPARGRKHSHNHIIGDMVNHFKTTSPQGDGNCENVRSSDVGLSNFKTTSPQGDGNPSSSTMIRTWMPTFQNHIPARGRKLVKSSLSNSVSTRFQNHIPARGRKPLRSIDLIDIFCYFKTTSPQGDGNAATSNAPTKSPRGRFQNHIPARGRKPSKSDLIIMSKEIISKPHPRKGTETPSFR